MKRRTLILLGLMVAVPLAVLGWLGVRLDASERALREDLMDQVFLEELKGIEQTIAAVVSRREEDLSADLSAAPLGPDALRERLRRSPYVTQYFIVDARGVLRFPTYDANPRPAEEEFLLRSRDIWLNGELTAQSAAEQVAAQTSKGLAAKSAPSRAERGWHVWHWGRDIHLIYWVRHEDGVVAGAEVNRPRLLADIIAALPYTDPEGGEMLSAVSEARRALGSTPWHELPKGRLELRDSQSNPLYIWDNGSTSDHVATRVSMPLRAPLSAWSLARAVDPGETPGSYEPAFWYRLSTRLGAVAIALIGMAIYFYRESARDMREAAQRVSFVNQVSHELKTPLTNIRMYAEMLDQNLDETEETSKRHIGVLVSESQRLSRLIANILTFSRKERRALSLRTAPGVVDASIRNVLAQFAPALQSKGIEVHADLDAARPAQFDADALEQIVGNLISNVEKYAESGKRLDVTSRQNGETVSITVADAGPGIPAKARNRIFEPFYRVSDKLTDGVTGTGIGLTIARDLARLHGGDLALEPAERGARFQITLRCPPAGAST